MVQQQHYNQTQRKCYHCGDEGHLRNQCPAFKQQIQQQCCRVYDRQDGFLRAGSGNAAKRVGETEKKGGATETEKGTSRSTRSREDTHARTPLFIVIFRFSLCLCVNLFVGQPATNRNLYFRVLYEFIVSTGRQPVK